MDNDDDYERISIILKHVWDLYSDFKGRDNVSCPYKKFKVWYTLYICFILNELFVFCLQWSPNRY